MEMHENCLVTHDLSVFLNVLPVYVPHYCIMHQRPGADLADIPKDYD
jgi:hypothetical protein